VSIIASGSPTSPSSSNAVRFRSNHPPQHTRQRTWLYLFISTYPLHQPSNHVSCFSSEVAQCGIFLFSAPRPPSHKLALVSSTFFPRAVPYPQEVKPLHRSFPHSALDASNAIAPVASLHKYLHPISFLQSTIPISHFVFPVCGFTR
jgi:hypothetical protein